jgi:protein SCO1/2
MLCTQVLNGLTRSLKPLALDVGKDFDVIVVSIDPNEKPDLSALKKRLHLKQYDREGTEAGWHFLTGDQSSITTLAQTIGFRYTYNPKTRLFAHAAGVTLVTPKGRVARYLFGLDFPPRDLQFGLVEASAGKIGSPIARVLLLCYDYDAASGKYTFAIMRMTRILGSSTFLILVAVVLWLFRRERRRATLMPPLGVHASLPPL